MKSRLKTWNQPNNKTTVADIDRYIGEIGTRFVDKIRHIRATMALYSNLSWGVFVAISLALDLSITIPLFIENGPIAFGVLLVVVMLQVFCGLFYSVFLDPWQDCYCDTCEVRRHSTKTGRR